MDDFLSQFISNPVKYKKQTKELSKMIEGLTKKLFTKKEIAENLSQLKLEKIKKEELKKELNNVIIQNEILKGLLIFNSILIINLVKPEMIQQKLKIVLKEQTTDSSSKLNYLGLLKMLLNMIEDEVSESIRKKKLKFSPVGQKKWLDLAITLYKKNKPGNSKYTKLVALIEANKELNHVPEDSILKNSKNYINILQQHENKILKKN